MQSREERLAWLAGIIDGEACIYARITNKAGLECRLDIQVTSERMIDAIQSIYTEIGVLFKRQPTKWQPKSTRPVHRVVVNRKASIISLLNHVKGYLRVKDREAEAVLAFLAAHPKESGETRSTAAHRLALVAEVKGLKKVA